MNRRANRSSHALVIVGLVVLLIPAGSSAESEPTPVGEKTTPPVGETKVPPVVQKSPRPPTAEDRSTGQMKGKGPQPPGPPAPEGAMMEKPVPYRSLHVPHSWELSAREVSRGDRVRIDFRIINSGDGLVPEVEYSVNIEAPKGPWVNRELRLDYGRVREIPAGGHASVSRLFTIPGDSSVCGWRDIHLRLYTPTRGDPRIHRWQTIRVLCPGD